MNLSRPLGAVVSQFWPLIQFLEEGTGSAILGCIHHRSRDIGPSSWGSVRGYSRVKGAQRAKIGCFRPVLGTQSLLTQTLGGLGQLLFFGRFSPFWPWRHHGGTHRIPSFWACRIFFRLKIGEIGSLGPSKVQESDLRDPRMRKEVPWRLQIGLKHFLERFWCGEWVPTGDY